jgi:hypothetical protein
LSNEQQLLPHQQQQQQQTLSPTPPPQQPLLLQSQQRTSCAHHHPEYPFPSNTHRYKARDEILLQHIGENGISKEIDELEWNSIAESLGEDIYHVFLAMAAKF